MKALINLIKLFKDETIRITFFENIGDKTISYEDFINIEETDNLKMLIELLNNNLIAESILFTQQYRSINNYIW